MAYSSILGADPAPSQPRGRSNDLLGPSDNSDSGSDALGTGEDRADSDYGGTGERGGVYGPDAVEGADIAPDRVVRLGAGDDDALGETADDEGLEAGDATGADGQEYTDLDADGEAGEDEDR